jgi:hypothetical protein
MVGQTLIFLHFSDYNVHSFNRWMHEAARQHNCNNISFLIGDVSSPERAFQVIYSYCIIIICLSILQLMH